MTLLGSCLLADMLKPAGSLSVNCKKLMRVCRSAGDGCFGAARWSITHCWALARGLQTQPKPAVGGEWDSCSGPLGPAVWEREPRKRPKRRGQTLWPSAGLAGKAQALCNCSMPGC